jgi:hypothetical protein
MNVYVYSRELAEECVSLCGRGSKTKRLSSKIFNWSVEAKEQFLLGHLLGDGVIQDNIVWMTSSRDLAEDLQLLLASIGYQGNMSYRNKYACDDVRADIYQVALPKNEFLPVLLKNKDLFRDKDLLRLKRTSSSGRKMGNEKYVYRTILSVEETEYEPMYDISLLDEPHSFVANGVVVSNCPAHRYWAYEYMSTVLGYAYGPYRTYRAPTRNNTKLRGTICKHTHKAIDYVLQNRDQLVNLFAAYYRRLPSFKASFTALDEEENEVPLATYEPDGSVVLGEESENNPVLIDDQVEQDIIDETEESSLLGLDLPISEDGSQTEPEEE